MSSVDSSVVVLKSQADWPRWLAVIQTKANHNSVWDYIKLPPAVGTISTAPDATLQSLTTEQLKRYEMAYKVYKDKLKDWERKQIIINDINDYIMRITGAY
jgi:hypothetical protein